MNRITHNLYHIDLTAAIFALGMHQEPREDAEYPFFMCELRRTTFWMTFVLDKSLATFFGRPPMINSKYCSCKLPLDIEEHELALTGTLLEDVKKQLDVEGWNHNGAINQSTWLRGTVLNMKIREEILELSLGADAENLDFRVA